MLVRPFFDTLNLMNFQELKIIVGQIKKTMPCPKCGLKFTDEDIDYIGSVCCDQGYLSAICHECSSELVVSVNFNTHPETLPMFDGKLGTAPRMGVVSVNEVLDMQNFLKEFKGDFKEIFKS